jgi:hypothetical protein
MLVGMVYSVMGSKRYGLWRRKSDDSAHSLKYRSQGQRHGKIRSMALPVKYPTVKILTCTLTFILRLSTDRHSIIQDDQ